jgi:hypothetical protein
VSKIDLHCTECKHYWEGALELPAPVKEAAAWMKAVTCPNCGAGLKKIHVKSKPTNEKES